MKPLRLLRIAVVAVAAAAGTAMVLALAACAPPYLEALDRTAALTGKMTTVGTIPSIGLQTSESNPRLLPPKPTVTSISQLNVQSGFLVTDSAAGQNVYWAFLDSSGQTQTSSATSALPMTGANANYPFYQYEVAATTTTANLVIFKMDPTTPSNSTAELITANPSPTGGATLAVAATALPSFVSPAGLSVIGEQVVPAPNGAADSFRWMISNLAGSFQEVPSYVLSTISPMFSTFPATPASQPTYPNVPRVMYYTTLTRSYVQYYSNGWICDDITGAAVRLTGITHRIDALLSTGDLLSTENDTLTLYDPNGNPLLSIPMGGLHFCYEAYLGTTPYVFFSLALELQHNNWAFVIYAIPTSQMRGL